MKGITGYLGAEISSAASSTLEYYVIEKKLKKYCVPTELERFWLIWPFKGFWLINHLKKNFIK